MAHKTLLLAYVIIAVGVTFANPSNSKESSNDGQAQAGNLKFTFENSDDIPSAFFEDSASKTRGEPEPRRIYPPCQDGSGGLCLSKGECPTHLRPENSAPEACKPDFECCYGVPTSDRSCESRGGQCVPASACGLHAPKAPDTDCSADQTCCILI